MSDRDILIAHIREAIADDPEIDAISLSPDLKDMLGLDEIDGVVILSDMSIVMNLGGRLH